MSQQLFGIKKAVKREGLDNYLRLMLLSFASSVIAVRLFLSLTGYPQISNGTIHIAHVLWGGLLLFVASVVPLIIANRWAFTLSAILSGVGMGLFIDEIGKFITQSNDYFYPPAAPIIYAFFILSVLFYSFLKKHPSRDARSELYRSLDSFQEVLDHDLDRQEKSALKNRLKKIIETSQDDALKELAISLLKFLNSDSLRLKPEEMTVADKFAAALKTIDEKLITRRVLKVLLIVSFMFLGVSSFLEAMILFKVFVDPVYLQSLLEEFALNGSIVTDNSFPWYIARMSLEGLVGVILIISARLFLKKKERKAVKLAALGLLLSLTTINLLVFYFDQFQAVLISLLQFSLLAAVYHYKNHFLE